MESSAQQLLAAIHIRPDDDAPRLDYASWLADRGDPRGEFIRAQCELARLAPSDPRHKQLRARERELLATYGAAWVGLSDLVGPQPARVYDRDTALLRLRGGPPDYAEIAVGFERGFPAEVAANAGLIARHAAAIAALGAPRLRATVWNEVAYTDWADDQRASAGEQAAYDERALADMTALARSGYAGRVTDLSLASAVGGYAEHLGALLDLLVHAGFDRLERLTIDFGWLRAEHVSALANWPGLARLRALALPRASLSAALVRQLFEQGGGGALESLDLSSNEVGADTAVALAECPQLAGLTRLNLSASRLGALGLGALAAAQFWPSLRALDLSGEWQPAELGWQERITPSLGAPGFAVLLRELPRARLADLALRHSRLGDDALSDLAAAPGAAELRRLDLFSNPIGDVGAFALADSSYLTGLEYLRIYSQSLSPAGERRLRERFGTRVSFGA
jgi:uncharacterized protein (TIGR02996 family)